MMSSISSLFLNCDEKISWKSKILTANTMDLFVLFKCNKKAFQGSKIFVILLQGKVLKNQYLLGAAVPQNL